MEPCFARRGIVGIAEPTAQWPKGHLALRARLCLGGLDCPGSACYASWAASKGASLVSLRLTLPGLIPLAAALPATHRLLRSLLAGLPFGQLGWESAELTGCQGRADCRLSPGSAKGLTSCLRPASWARHSNGLTSSPALLAGFASGRLGQIAAWTAWPWFVGFANRPVRATPAGSV